MLKYASNKFLDDLDIPVPMPDKSLVTIKHLFIDTGKDNLCVFSCHSGKGAPQIKAM